MQFLAVLSFDEKNTGIDKFESRLKAQLLLDVRTVKFPHFDPPGQVTLQDSCDPPKGALSS